MTEKKKEELRENFRKLFETGWQVKVRGVIRPVSDWKVDKRRKLVLLDLGMTLESVDDVVRMVLAMEGTLTEMEVLMEEIRKSSVASLGIQDDIW